MRKYKRLRKPSKISKQTRMPKHQQHQCESGGLNKKARPMIARRDALHR